MFKSAGTRENGKWGIEGKGSGGEEGRGTRGCRLLAAGRLANSGGRTRFFTPLSQLSPQVPYFIVWEYPTFSVRHHA